MENNKWLEVFEDGDVWELEEEDGKLLGYHTGNDASDYDSDELVDNGISSPQEKAKMMHLKFQQIYEDRYMVVDDFSGSILRYVNTEEEGRRWMEDYIEKVHNTPGQRNIMCMYDVVPDTYTYGWDERENKYVWS